MTSKNKLILGTLQFAKEDRLLSWYYLISTLIFAGCTFAMTIVLTNTVLRLFFGSLAGLLTARLVVIYHDFQHEAILKGSRFAEILMNTVGILTLTPSSIWDESHEHHHHTNSKFATFVLGSFPTLSTVTYRNLSKAQQFKYRLIRHPLMIAFAYVPIFLISFCLWPFFENPKKYWDCGLSAAGHGVIAYLLWNYGGWTSVAYTLIIPSFIAFALGGYIFYAQHNFPEVILRNDSDWDYFDAALQSSSFIRMNRIMRWFTANIGFHHIHHVNERIPFYHLPKAMATFPEFQNPRSTSLHPKEVWACLQLKLWDDSRGRMISMKEFDR